MLRPKLIFRGRNKSEKKYLFVWFFLVYYVSVFSLVVNCLNCKKKDPDLQHRGGTNLGLPLRKLDNQRCVNWFIFINTRILLEFLFYLRIQLYWTGVRP